MRPPASFRRRSRRRMSSRLRPSSPPARILIEQRSQSFNDQAVAAVTTFPAVGAAGAAAANFERLVLGCMDSYDSEKRGILQHFSRSTRFASFCTFLISEILQICVKIFLIFAEISQEFSFFFLQKSGNFREKIAKNMQNLRLERSKRIHIL